ncbi:MAG: hypothetical protein RIS35_3445, partial [Pseudomonadota bacterium]
MNDRRNLLRVLGASAAALATQRAAHAATYIPTVPTTGVTGRVVVVGGGMGGASVAKYLRLWGGAKLEVVVVEPDAAYLSNIMSNFVLTGARTLSSLGYTLSTLVKRYGIQVVQGRVSAITPSATGGTVTVGTTTIAYDRLVLAPGLDFAAVPGVAPEAQQYFPHAWKTGPQTTELRRQLLAMPATSGQFLMSIPAAPYRCPPGPYERACLIADWLQRNRPGSKVYVLDENADVVAENATFRRAFSTLYPNTIVYLPGTMITSVQGGSTGGGTVYTANVTGIVAGAAQAGSAGQTFTNLSVISPITPQRAGSVLGTVNGGGLLNALGGRFAGVNVLSYESTGVPRIHVIGDAAQTTQPKAGHIANQEGKVCADAIVRLMGGLPLDPAP